VWDGNEINTTPTPFISQNLGFVGRRRIGPDYAAGDLQRIEISQQKLICLNDDEGPLHSLAAIDTRSRHRYSIATIKATNLF